MNIALNYSNRIKKIMELMKAQKIDAFIGTRTVSVSYVLAIKSKTTGEVVQ